jgi:DNA mismatch endonuclease, patch repair protein
MTDIVSKKLRSKLMSKVRGRDTKPEWILRCGLHRLGFRYRIHNNRLPGCPDLVFPKFQAAVFVHGCYWHRHSECKDASTPKSNVDFWEKKFAENVERDHRSIRQLESLGWRVLVAWECELTRKTVETICRVAFWLSKSNAYNFVGVKQHELLSVAEQKMRYRISSYENDPELNESILIK